MADQIIKLYYFNVAYRAEAIRLAFAIGGVPFEDIRVSGEDFKKKKAEGFFKFGQMPVIEVGGKQYAQQIPILNYVGRISGLFPTDPIEAMKCEEAESLGLDLMSKQGKAQRQAYVDEYLPTILTALEALLTKNGTGFLVGNKLSVADVFWYQILRHNISGILDGVPQDCFKTFPNVCKLFDTVDNNEKVKAWNEAHKK